MGSIGTMCLQSDIRIGIGQDEGAVDVALFAFVAHHKTRLETHIRERLVQVPRHAEAGAPAHPGIDIILVAVVKLARAGGAPRLFQTDDFRQVLVGDVRNLVAEIDDFFEFFWGHIFRYGL
jgi:hypothetical protein